MKCFHSPASKVRVWFEGKENGENEAFRSREDD